MFVNFIVFPEILCAEKREEASDEHKEEAKVEGDQVSLAKWLEQWNYNLEPPRSISTLTTTVYLELFSIVSSSTLWSCFSSQLVCLQPDGILTVILLPINES